MPVSKIGLVYYQDDPDQKIFRMIFPTTDDSELDDIRWITEGCNPLRNAILIQVDANDVKAQSKMNGIP